MTSRKQFLWIVTVAGTLVLASSWGFAQQDQDSPAAEGEQLQELSQEQPVESDQPATEGTEGDGAQGAPTGKRPPGGLFGGSYFPFVLIGAFVLLYIWMGRNKRKQEAKRKEMLSSLKKGDKVTSIGGIIGTVIEVREDEVTVKVDETNNIRLKFLRRSISGVGEDAKSEQ